MIRDIFHFTGRKVYLVGLQLILLNVILSIFFAAIVVVRGEPEPVVDTLDVALETANMLVHFFSFCVIAMVALKRWIKRCVFSGLFLTQQGIMLDMLDEYVEIRMTYWHIIGDFVYLIGALLVLFGVANWILFNYRISTLDKLTKVHNRRFFEAMVKHYLARQSRVNEPACLMTIDVDNFKQINDTYGHAAGDKVLVSVARLLKQTGRKADVICRSGGEEFEILLMGADEHQGEIAAERILTELRTLSFPDLPRITASIGVTSVKTTDHIDSLRKRSDEGMYVAKRSGKNRVVVV